MALTREAKNEKRRQLAAQRALVCAALEKHQRYTSGNGEIICLFCGARNLTEVQ